jgi:NAD(P)-dependent dehydrogenase (short-subunit alcohol dehydrogenase family)
MNRHADKVVIVTGAGRGLGRAYARRLAAEGARVGIAEVQEDRGEETAAAIRREGGQATFHPTDVSSEASTREMAGRFMSDWGQIDGLVANAALADSVGGARYDEITVEDWDRLMAVNVRGTWLTCKAVAPHMQEIKRGSIVTIGSDTALWGSPNLLHYVTTKGAVTAFTRAMARELGGDDVRINCVAPGLVRNEATAGVPAEKHEWNVGHRAIQRDAKEGDIVGVVSFLLSDDAAFITGQLIVVNGGLVFD